MPEPGAPRPDARLRYGEGVLRRAYLLVGSEGRVHGMTRGFKHRPELLLADAKGARSSAGGDRRWRC